MQRQSPTIPMQKCFTAVGACCVCMLAAITQAAAPTPVLTVNPYADIEWEQIAQHKANLHTHTTESDGNMGVDRIVHEYYSRGYGILAITDHNRCSWPWSKFGVNTAGLSMIGIPGNELSRHHHTLSLFVDFEHPSSDFDTVLRQVAEANGLAVLCHPAMHWPNDFRTVPALQIELQPALRALTQGDFTVEAWFRTTDDGRGILLGNYPGAGGGVINLELHTNNRVRIFVAPHGSGKTIDLNVAADSVGVNTRDGKWHHLAALRRDHKISLYLDAKHVAGAEDTAGSFDLQGDKYFIGRDYRRGSTVFEGDLDDVRLWQRALTTRELTAIVAGNAPSRSQGPRPTALVAQYMFDEVAGRPARPGSTVTTAVTDSAGHPAGPFHATATKHGAPMYTEQVAPALLAAGDSARSLRFNLQRDTEKGVPAEAVQAYIHRFRTHPHLLGMEVLNGTRPLREYPLDRELWDHLLTNLMPERPVWGFSNDDTHGMQHLGRDWIWVLTPRLEHGGVREAISEGAFFLASTRIRNGEKGSLKDTPRIQRVEHNAVSGDITIEASLGEQPLDDRAYQWIAGGKVIHTGPTLNYRRTPGITNYVRAELKGDGGITLTNPFGFKTN